MSVSKAAADRNQRTLLELVALPGNGAFLVTHHTRCTDDLVASFLSPFMHFPSSCTPASGHRQRGTSYSLMRCSC